MPPVMPAPGMALGSVGWGGDVEDISCALGSEGGAMPAPGIALVSVGWGGGAEDMSGVLGWEDGKPVLGSVPGPLI